MNIFLELIARYIIETMNPTLKNRVERRIKQYEMHSQYKVMLERERGENRSKRHITQRCPAIRLALTYLRMFPNELL